MENVGRERVDVAKRSGADTGTGERGGSTSEDEERAPSARDSENLSPMNLNKNGTLKQPE